MPSFELRCINLYHKNKNKNKTKKNNNVVPLAFLILYSFGEKTKLKSGYYCIRPRYHGVFRSHVIGTTLPLPARRRRRPHGRRRLGHDIWSPDICRRAACRQGHRTATRPEKMRGVVGQ
jgi:hypothetical protein